MKGFLSAKKAGFSKRQARLAVWREYARRFTMEEQKEKKKDYKKPEIEQTEKISRVFLACVSQIASCADTLQQAGTCP